MNDSEKDILIAVDLIRKNIHKLTDNQVALLTREFSSLICYRFTKQRIQLKFISNKQERIEGTMNIFSTLTKQQKKKFKKGEHVFTEITE